MPMHSVGLHLAASPRSKHMSLSRLTRTTFCKICMRCIFLFMGIVGTVLGDRQPELPEIRRNGKSILLSIGV